VLEKFGTEYKGSEVAGEANFALGLAYVGQARDDKDLAAQQHAYGQAIQTLTTVIADATITAATRQQAVLSLGQAQYALGEKAEAEASFARALTLLPDADSRVALETRLQHAHILFNLARYAEANTEYATVANISSFPIWQSKAGIGWGTAVSNWP